MSLLQGKLHEVDLQMIEIYRDFIPEKIFDAHMHLYLAETVPTLYNTTDEAYNRKVCTVEDYMTDMAPLFPSAKELRLNMITAPDAILTETSNGLRDKINYHVIRQHKLHPKFVVSPYVLPNDSESFIYSLVEQPGVRGLKCYVYGATIQDVERASIKDFLPEAAWVVAHEKKLPIILHMMRPAALSDSDNFAYITRMVHRYPNAQLVLAHCARAFASWTCIDAIKKLDDCGNIWFDMSAICESGPMMMCIMKYAGKRTMWGSDYPVCMRRGRAVSVGMGQNWLLGEQFSEMERAIVGTENLMAFWQASRILNLDETQIADLFYGNAEQLFTK